MTRSMGGRCGASSPMDAAIADAHEVRDRVTDASGTKQAPSGNRSTQSPASCERQPRLARAAGAGERQQPRPVEQRRPRRRPRPAPTNVVSCGGRLLGVQRRASGAAGSRRSRPGASSWYSRSGAREVLEPVLAEVAQADPVADSPARARVASDDEDLAAVGRRRDAGRAVDLDADVVAADDLDLAGVDAHAHPHVAAGPRVGGERALRPRRRRGPPPAADGKADEEARRPRIRTRTPPSCRRRPRTRSPGARQQRRRRPRRRCRVSRRVEPSMSVNRKVTMPSGSGPVTPAPAAC